MVTFVNHNETVTQRPFAEGRLEKDGAYLGRPVDVHQLRDGSLLVSDNFAGAIYRIWYEGRLSLGPIRPSGERKPTTGRTFALYI